MQGGGASKVEFLNLEVSAIPSLLDNRAREDTPAAPRIVPNAERWLEI
jgi:hypothetical protein